MMRPYNPIQRDTKKAQEDSIAHLHGEIERRKREGWELASENAIPGDDLVAWVGRLTLLASPALLYIYEQTKWPRVRESLGMNTPGPLAVGDFSACVLQTRALVDTTREFRAAARTQPMVLSRWEQDCLTLFINRLEAGYFLTGLEALWPVEGCAAARKIRRDGLLEEWDEELHACRDQFVPIQDGLRDILADLPVSLSGPWFDGVRSMASSVLNEGGMGNSPHSPAQHATRRDTPLIRKILLEDFMQTITDGEPHGPAWSVTEETSSFFILQHSNTAVVGVWFTDEQKETLEISRETGVSFDALVRAEILELTVGEEDEAGAVRIIGLMGYIEKERWAIPEGQSVIDPDMFIGDHEETRSFITRMFA